MEELTERVKKGVEERIKQIAEINVKREGYEAEKTELKMKIFGQRYYDLDTFHKEKNKYLYEVFTRN